MCVYVCLVYMYIASSSAANSLHDIARGGPSTALAQVPPLLVAYGVGVGI